MKASLMMLLAATLSAQPALADDDDHHHRHRHHQRHCDDHWGRVTEVIPIYEEVEVREPYESCDIAYEEEGGGSYSATPTIIGGIIGAAIGNGVGHGKRNKQVGAVAGGLLGASIGHDLGGGSGSRRRSEGYEVCETRYRVSYREELVGYEVHYRHHGRHYLSRSRHHPGDRYWLGDDHRH